MKKPDYFARQLGGNERLAALQDKLSDRDHKTKYRDLSNEARRDVPALKNNFKKVWGFSFISPINPDIDTIN